MGRSLAGHVLSILRALAGQAGGRCEVKEGSLIIFNQRRSIISWLTPPLHHHSSPLLSPRPRPPFTSHSIFSSHCPVLHAPSELHYFFPLLLKEKEQQYVIVSALTKTSALWLKSSAFFCCWVVSFFAHSDMGSGLEAHTRSR